MLRIQTLLLIAHVLLAAGLIAFILLQRGKGAEAGTAFGAGASGTVFGSRGSGSFMTRTTAVLATLFFVTSLSLAFLGGRQQVAPESIMERIETMPADAPLDALPLEPDATDLPDLPGAEGEVGTADDGDAEGGS